jgi:hypothetical protein
MDDLLNYSTKYDILLVGCPSIVDALINTLQQKCLLSLKKTKLHGLSPRANYTDRATAACRRSDCQFFADRGCHVVSVTDLYGHILSFLDKSRYFSIKKLLSCIHEAKWTPFQTRYFFLVVPGIEPGPPDL